MNTEKTFVLLDEDDDLGCNRYELPFLIDQEDEAPLKELTAEEACAVSLSAIAQSSLKIARVLEEIQRHLEDQ